MDATISHNINYPEIAQAIDQTRSRRPELKELSDKEVLTHVIKEHPAASSIPVTSVMEHSPSENKKTEMDVLPEYAHDAPDAIKRIVESLVSETLEKGLLHGLSLARKQDPMILDMFHDALADKMIEHMRARKLL
ncbi:MAG: hypothetical protein KBC26_00595 [Candidatus Pacebacteria bacterium]|nr:hypothetical protein [Candidatus Paceibacterota bacterium]